MNLADALNQGCLCSTLQSQLLRNELESHPAAQGLADDLAANNPHIFSATPVFISARDHDVLERTVAALHRVSALPGYRSAALQRSAEIASHEFGPQGAFMGYDFHLGAQGPRLIEINTNAGGALLHAAAARAHRACCTPMDRMFGAPADLDRIDEVWIDMFRAEWRAQRGDAPLRSVAIVDDAPGEQYLAPEFELARQLFEAHGIHAVVADPRQLEWRDGLLWHPTLPEGMPVDLVYNRLTDFDFSQPGHSHLRDAYVGGAVVVTPHPRAHALHADKRNLVALSDGGLLASWGASAEDRALLHDVVPPTEPVTLSNADALWSRRRHLFFKPATGYGSKAAYRGDKLTRRVWADILAGNFVAQALVPPGERLVDIAGEPTRLKFDIRAYAYAGRIQLLAARTYSGQTTNFRTAGGGFSPVVVVSNRPLNVLFLCTHNSARSILAEATLNQIGQGRFKAFSAGSNPRENQQPNPLGLQVLREAGIPTEGLRSKSWDEFARPDSPHMDLVITVCDDAAGEQCPYWPGQPATAHWGYPDPSALQGTDAQRLDAFRRTLIAMRRRLDLLVNLPMARVEKLGLQSQARKLAQEDAS